MRRHVTSPHATSRHVMSRFAAIRPGIRWRGWHPPTSGRQWAALTDACETKYFSVQGSNIPLTHSTPSGGCVTTTNLANPLAPLRCHTLCATNLANPLAPLGSHTPCTTNLANPLAPLGTHTPCAIDLASLSRWAVSDIAIRHSTFGKPFSSNHCLCTRLLSMLSTGRGPIRASG
jgi:hypothetical protein